ncbi:head GIN domain-containing protein [Runella sp.]|uniref:head GIN domain-containing protein n=1 Tax=Runella sp. TaxID=1960881 RepID=UPI003D0B9703
MKKLRVISAKLASFAFLLALLQSCIFIDGDTHLDPKNPDNQTFDLRDFDQLEMGNAFNVSVRRSGQFSIFVHGDRRDISDLEAFVDRNGKLVIRYRNYRIRRYDMDIDITMPTLRGVDFSGAVNSNIEGFTNTRDLDIELSGASKSTVDGDWERVYVDLSGASTLTLHGQGLSLTGDLSGASKLNGFDYAVDNVDLELSGASNANVLVDKTLKVDASGASSLRYRGSPEVRSNSSGGSSVKKD